MNSPSWLDASREDIASPLSPPGAYYAVHLPGEDGGQMRSFISDNKEEALKIARKNRKSRFKAFATLPEAEAFAENGPPIVVSSPPAATEKGSPFKAPKPMEMTQLRRAVESGDPNEVAHLVSANPRLLVGSGDTPALVQEGFRFNCLHIAARTNQAAVAEYILGRIADPSFLGTLYGDDDDHDALARRAHVLVDLYLNTPDKVVNETPLHLAAKFGAIETARVLLSYPQCDRTVKNKRGQTAIDLAASAGISENTRDELIKLLSGGVFVAVLRSPDLAEEPLLVELPAGSAPPCAGGREVAALVGPIGEDEAATVRRLWRKPLLSPAGSPEARVSPSLVPERRLEAIGRALSVERSLPWSEYWPFLGCFANFHTLEGLQKLETYLSNRLNSAPSPVDGLCNALGNLKLSPDDDSLCHVCIERTARLYAGKLARALCTRTSHLAFTTLLNKIHSLIRSCAEDKRYAGVEFERMHSRLASLTKDAVGEDRIAALEYLINFDNEENSFKGANSCLVRHLMAALSDEGGGDCSESDARLLWKEAHACLCDLAGDSNPRAKRLDFSNPTLLNGGSCLMKGSSFVEDGHLSDSSDDTFYTPDSSPHLSPASSTEDMVSADESSMVFIYGSEPSRMDAAVHDAIDPNMISADSFPSIYEWFVSFRGFLRRGGQVPPPRGYSTIPKMLPCTKCVSPEIKYLTPNHYHSPMNVRSVYSA